MKKHSSKLVIGCIFTIMILIAMGDNVRGVFIPSFKLDFSANNTEMGFMLVASSLGYIISTYIGGILCEKAGQKKVMVLGFSFVIGALFILYMSPNFTILLAGMFLSNIGVSLLAISINTIIPVLAISFQAVLMNLTHFSYGVGATITQRTAGVLISKGIAWRSIYLIIAVLFLIVFLAFIPIKVPERERVKDDKKIDYKNIFSNKLIYFYMIALGLYVAAEMSTGNWFVNFMTEEYNYNENQSTYYTALFFGVFTVGRLLGGFVVERIGAIKSVLISSIVAFFMYTIGLVIGQSGIVIIAASGLFFSITFPTIVLTISRVFKKHSAYITGIVVTAASTISMLINLLIGWLNDLIGVYITYYTIPISLFISCIFIYLIYVNTRETLRTS